MTEVPEVCAECGHHPDDHPNSNNERCLKDGCQCRYYVIRAKPVKVTDVFRGITMLFGVFGELWLLVQISLWIWVKIEPDSEMRRVAPGYVLMTAWLFFAAVLLVAWWFACWVWRTFNRFVTERRPTDDAGDRTTTTPAQPAQSLSSQEHALGDAVWDFDSGRVARVAGIGESSDGATYELGYADGSRRQVKDWHVEKWSPEVEPELRRRTALRANLRVEQEKLINAEVRRLQEVRRLEHEERIPDGNKQPDSKRDG